MKYLIIRAVEDTQLVSDVKRLAESLGEFPELVAEPVLIAVSGLEEEEAWMR